MSSNEDDDRWSVTQEEELNGFDDGEPEWVNIDVSIKTVETWDKLDKVKEKLARATLIGIDSEWSPRGPERTSLLQVATKSKVWLIDVKKLGSGSRKWIPFFRQLLCSETIKLGYDLGNDLRVLLATFPFLNELIGRERNLICLFKTLGRVKRHTLGDRVFGGDAPELNLKAVAKHFTDIDLDKGKRLFDWELRPLSENRRNYAAMDAFCLIPCYEAISHRLEDVGLQFLLTEVKFVYRPPGYESKKAHKRRIRREYQAREVVGAVAASDDERTEVADNIGKKHIWKGDSSKRSRGTR